MPRHIASSLRALVVIAVVPALSVAAPPDRGGRGRYAVGRTRVTFTTTAETTGEPRPLDTIVWYPAVPDTGTPQGTVLRDADVRKQRWPLVIFSHGACSFPEQAPFFTEGLASWGFVVAAPPHPGSTIRDPDCFTVAAFPDAATNRVADVRAVLVGMQALARDASSRFAGRIHRRRSGIGGHSFGGYTTLRVLPVDRRFRAGVALAPAVVSGAGLGLTARVRQPTLVMVGERDSLTPIETAGQAAFGLLDGPRFLVEILNTGHCAFAVGCIPSACGTGCEATALPPDRANEVTMRYAVPFFLRYVRGRNVFPKSLRPDEAPDGVVVLESHPRR
jgi:predicted dienelactone hydrolase